MLSTVTLTAREAIVGVSAEAISSGGLDSNATSSDNGLANTS